MRRPRSLLASAFLALALLGGATLGAPAPVAAATIAATTTCSNGVDNTPGLGLICTVTVENTITALGGTSRTTVRECHGAAGDPQADCTTTVRLLPEIVTNVTQCNNSINGGGGTLRCSVRVVNTWVGVDPASTPGTVNQCVGSGGGITTGCDPFPATTTNARVTQCNDSANGGTLVGLECLARGTMSATHIVRITQCNDSANGGGALVICSANVINFVRPTATATATPSSAPTAAPSSTISPSATPSSAAPTPAATPSATPRLPETSAVLGDSSTPTSAPIGLAALITLFAATVLIVVARRQTARRAGLSNETPRSRSDTNAS